MLRTCYINRGLPGSGKSHRTRSMMDRLARQRIPAVACSSDNYFIGEDKVYRFVRANLVEAHRRCQTEARSLMQSGTWVVIIDNTNITAAECRPYVQSALAFDYDVHFLEPETPWAFDLDELHRRNVHGVPRATLELMLSRWVPDMTVEKALASQLGRPLTNDEKAAIKAALEYRP